jgi:hypothetical protein
LEKKGVKKLATLTGTFVLLDQVPGTKNVYLTLHDIETKRQFQVSLPALVDDKLLNQTIRLQLDGLSVSKGITKDGKPYVSIQAGSLKKLETK